MEFCGYYLKGLLDIKVSSIRDTSCCVTCVNRIEIEESSVAGSFNMIFLGYSISLGYRNHTNVVMRYVAYS